MLETLAVNGLTRRAALLATGAAVLTGGCAQTQPQRQEPDGDAVTSPAGTTVRFAPVAAGRAVLTADDEWMRATSEFQRRAVMQSATPVTMDDFVRHNGNAVQPWQPDQRVRWRRALDTVLPAFAALRVPLPRDVLLVASNGQESAGAPYTRGNAVVLPGKADAEAYTDELLMAHELWHVASRHAPALATRLYAEIGFQAVPELAFPPSWAPVRIANPDAPNNRHAMALDVAGRAVRVTPVMVAARTVLEPGETFFSVLQVRLLEVQTDGDASRAVAGPDGPRWHAVNGAHDYLRKLGGNTGYVIHPEETMADNIALLATRGHAPSRQARSVRNPQLLDRIEAVLAAGS